MSTDWHRTLQSHLYLPRPMFRIYQLQAAPDDDIPATEEGGADAATVTLAVPLPQLMELLELCRPLGKSSLRPGQEMTAASDDLGERNLFTLEWSRALDHLSFR